MPHAPEPLGVAAFDPAVLLVDGVRGLQEKYVRGYLTDLDTKVVVTEPRYFDRDYLSEFAAYFGASARAYPNVCKRLHFFGDAGVDRATLLLALEGDVGSCDLLRRSYLGFVVVRPIEATPFGRSVLMMYPPDDDGEPPRCMYPARVYTPHLVGLALPIEGVAWQQQDASVSACATVALWSMLQSLAFDEHLAVPTTAALTRLANEAELSRGRVFPSGGLNAYQLSRAIRAAGLEPMIADPRNDATVFSSVVASLVRSRFPVCITGEIEGGGHAVCAVGFREAVVAIAPPEKVTPQDQSLTALYVHDDNLGPNVRFAIATAGASDERLVLKPSPPKRATARGSVTTNYAPIDVNLLIAAVPEGLRVSVTTVHRRAAALAEQVLNFFNLLLKNSGKAPVGFTYTVRFAKLAGYLSELLPTATKRGSVGRARLSFFESVAAPSLYIAIVRVGNERAFFDIIFDTTDGDHYLRPWCMVAFLPLIRDVLRALVDAGVDDFGTIVDAT